MWDFVILLGTTCDLFFVLSPFCFVCSMIDTLKKIICVIILVLGGLGKISTAAPPLPTLQKAGVATSGDTITIALTYSPIVPYKIFFLKNPHRLVLDTHNVNIPPNIQQSVSPKIVKSVGVIKAMRFGKQANNVKRIVWELKSSHRIVSRGYKNGVLYIRLKPGNDTTVYKSPSWGNFSYGQGGTPQALPPLQPEKPKFAPKKRDPNALKIVVIDAGHGGRDPGAIGVSKVREKDVNLKAARALRDELQKIKGYKVILTRNSDKFIELHERYKIAERAGADLFISIHADKLTNPNARGLSVYSMGFSSLERRVNWLRKGSVQNKVNLPEDVKNVDDPNVKTIVAETLQTGVARCSMDFADTVEYYIKKRSPIKTLPTTTRYAGYAVLKSLTVPAILVEMGFLSNRTDERLLTTNEFRQKFAYWMTRAIDAYMKKRADIGC